MKGLLLAGGSGSRLFPLTLVTNKHLLPVYDRPMIYYPLDTLREMGCTEVMVVVGGRSVGDVLELLHDGSDVGLALTYRYQRGALGIAHALGLARGFAGDEPLAVVLGDNILRAVAAPRRRVQRARGAPARCSRRCPTRIGSASPSSTVASSASRRSRRIRRAIGSRSACTSFADAFEALHELRPSARGEFEITDVLNHYVASGG